MCLKLQGSTILRAKGCQHLTDMSHCNIKNGFHTEPCDSSTSILRPVCALSTKTEALSRQRLIPLASCFHMSSFSKFPSIKSQT